MKKLLFLLVILFTQPVFAESFSSQIYRVEDGWWAHLKIPGQDGFIGAVIVTNRISSLPSSIFAYPKEATIFWVMGVKNYDSFFIVINEKNPLDIDILNEEGNFLGKIVHGMFGKDENQFEFLNAKRQKVLKVQKEEKAFNDLLYLKYELTDLNDEKIGTAKSALYAPLGQEPMVDAQAEKFWNIKVSDKDKMHPGFYIGLLFSEMLKAEALNRYSTLPNFNQKESVKWGGPTGALVGAVGSFLGIRYLFSFGPDFEVQLKRPVNEFVPYQSLHFENNAAHRIKRLRIDSIQNLQSDPLLWQEIRKLSQLEFLAFNRPFFMHDKEAQAKDNLDFFFNLKETLKQLDQVRSVGLPVQYIESQRQNLDEHAVRFFSEAPESLKTVYILCPKENFLNCSDRRIGLLRGRLNVDVPRTHLYFNIVENYDHLPE